MQTFISEDKIEENYISKSQDNFENRKIIAIEKQFYYNNPAMYKFLTKSKINLT